MSLLTEAFEDFCFMEQTQTADGYGGHTTAWAEGSTFLATADFDQSNVATVADKLTERVNCIITTRRNVILNEFDIIKRLSDGQAFRVLSNGVDTLTPASAWLDMRQSKAEKWVIPNG